MARPKAVGPSASLLLWTLYVILIAAAMAALFTALRGHDLASAGALTLLCQVIAAIRKLAGR